jgi:flagellin-like hook-associated protein FlgL
LDTESSAVDEAKTNWEGANRTVTDQEAERQKANVEAEDAQGQADTAAKNTHWYSPFFGTARADNATAQANLTAKQQAQKSWAGGARGTGLTAAQAARDAAQKALAQSRSTYGAHQLAYEKRQDDPMGLRSPAPRHGDCFAFSHSECNAISSRLG